MIKRTAVFIVVVLCVVGVGAAYKWYANRQAPEYATEQFVRTLTAGPKESQAWLSAELQKDRESYWEKYLADFTGKKGTRAPAGGASLDDRFNTYSDTEEPYRSLYIFDLNGGEYWLTIVVVRQDKGWKVDELHGSYHAR